VIEYATMFVVDD